MAEQPIFSKENFSKIIEFAPIGIVIVDNDNKWLLTNKRFCEIVGYKKEELEGKTFLDITHPDDRKQNMRLYERMREGEYNEYGYEKRYIRKDGTVIWVRLIVSATRDRGEYSHLVALIEDINETKLYQENIIKKNQELDRLFYKVSHDLKAPLTSLQGICNLLRIEYPTFEQHETFRHLDRVVDQLKNQNQSLLKLAEVHEHKPYFTEVYIERLVNKVLMEFPNTLTITKVNLNQSIITDFYLLSVVIKEIVDNAINYNTKKQVEIEIATLNQPFSNTIIIKDNGTGIPYDHRENVFKMFYKASDLSKGSGLGLYIANVAAEKIDAKLLLASSSAEGTSFEILIPIKKTTL